MASQLTTPRKRQNLSNGKWTLLKPQLPADWRKRLIAIAPEYDSLEGATLMQNVHQGRSKDETILTLWEKIIDDYQAEKAVREKRAANVLKRVKINIPK